MEKTVNNAVIQVWLAGFMQKSYVHASRFYWYSYVMSRANTGVCTQPLHTCRQCCNVAESSKKPSTEVQKVKLVRV